MKNKIKFNGVLVDRDKDVRDYNISMFIPHQDKITDEEYILNLPKLNIIIDQTVYNSCVGHSFAMAKSILEYHRTNKWMDIDPYMIYGTRYDNDYAGMGMYPVQGAKVLLKDGAFLRRDFNMQQEVPEIINTVRKWKEKHTDKVEEAKKLQITGYYFIYNNLQVKTALKYGMPVSVAYPIYESFYNTTDNGIVSVPKNNEQLQGYHQMLIVGWTKNNQWIVVNSWGTHCGLKGMYLIPFDYKFDSAIAISDTISPCKYKAKKIVFRPYKETFIIDNQLKIFDSKPYIKNDRIYVSVRFITEALGASVEWLNDTREIIVRSEEAIIKMKIGDNKIIINGCMSYLDSPPEIVNDRTMLPIRVITEALNCKVDWNDETREVTIISK